MNTPSLVDVVTPTYNQEQYLAQALDSALAQQTSFSVRLMVGDDCSTDGTSDIIAGYARRYPGRINAVYRHRNLGAAKNGSLLCASCNAKYLALLDGDDYWTCDYKLQRQVDFLEKHPDFAMCFHNAHNLHPDGHRTDYLATYGLPRKNSYGLTDVLTRNPIPTCSIVCRRQALGHLPPEYLRIPAGDRMLVVILAQSGRLGYIDEAWGIRRVHEGGIVSLKSRENKLLITIECLEIINSYLGRRYERVLRPAISGHWHDLAWQHLQESGGADLSPDSLRAVERALARWSEQTPLAEKSRRYVLGRLYISACLEAKRQGDRRLLRRNLFKAVGHRPSLLTRKGPWVMGLSALAGNLRGRPNGEEGSN